MCISILKLENIRGFISSEMIFSKNLNIIVGPNNSGKSTILQAIHSLQAEHKAFTQQDLRKREKMGTLSLKINTKLDYHLYKKNKPPYEHILTLAPNGPSWRFLAGEHFSQRPSAFPASEPDNLIYPYLSKRKVTAFSEAINSTHSNSVSGNFGNLYPKIDRISNQHFQPAHDEYEKACLDIIGFPITTVPSPNGKKGCYIIENLDHIPLDSMGEGVTNLLGLIVDLCMAQNNIFLIEEPENDVHPKALKRLLELIVSKSKNNQFFITTHSNIVTKYLGAQADSKIFSVSMKFNNKLPTSTIKEVGDSFEERRDILEELGYELFDTGLWAGWLILEESSAEKIIREYLIPWFTPALQYKLRTYSARSLSEVKVKFNDFNKLFAFLNLEPIYKNKAWIIVDAGENEAKIINNIKQTYTSGGWKENHFLQLAEHDFEKYYPSTFQERFDKIRALSDKQQKRTQKKELLESVEEWISEDNGRAQKEFASSANEVITFLKQIEDTLF